MYVTVRHYSNAGALIDAIESKPDEVETLVSGVSGFLAYYGTRDGDTYTSVTVCNEKAGCDESTRRAGQWVRENVDPRPGKPEITGGEGVIDF